MNPPENAYEAYKKQKVKEEEPIYNKDDVERCPGLYCLNGNDDSNEPEYF